MQGLALTRPQTLVHAVTERLRKAIVNAELGLGEALSEEGLANAFGVSRTPVREALSVLQLQGLIEIAPQRGSFVFRPTASDAGHLCEFRIMLEQAVAPLAAARAHARALSMLERQLAAVTCAFEERDGLAYVNSDDQLHQVFFDYCGNGYFQNAYALISSKMAALRTNLSARQYGDQELSLAEHGRIVQYFRLRDIASLHDLLETHIGRTKQNFLRAIDQGLLAAASAPRQQYPFSLPAA
jgi:DNA-binding GntR family transcriptional regulator